jgi:DNA polymerase
VHVSEDAQARKEAVAEVAAEALRHLTWLEAAGVREVPVPAPVQARAEPRAQIQAAPQATAAEAPSRPRGRAAGEPPVKLEGTRKAHSGGTPAGRDGDLRREGKGDPEAAGRYTLSDKGCGSAELLAVRSELGECARCKLAGGRTNLVFGVGSPGAALVFVGEGPGEDEDLKGEPFVGRAGQLLTKMIEAMGFRREEVYIANVVKCRPPGNRNPESDEIAACEGFLRAQLAAIGPRVIVALGKFAAQTLLRDTTPISKLRGRWFEYAGVKLMPTFHPAYLLRSPDEKKKAWEDLQLVMKELGRPPPER